MVCSLIFGRELSKAIKGVIHYTCIRKDWYGEMWSPVNRTQDLDSGDQDFIPSVAMLLGLPLFLLPFLSFISFIFLASQGCLSLDICTVDSPKGS